MALLINHESKSLKERLSELIRKSEELKFLVGYFYFSGFNEISDAIEKNTDLQKINILVGLEVDEINNNIIEIGTKYENKSDKEIKQIIIESLRKSFVSENCDTKEFYEQAKLFLKLYKEQSYRSEKQDNPIIQNCICLN